MKVINLLLAQCLQAPQDVMLQTADESVTFGDLLQLVQEMVFQIYEMGLSKGDRVVVVANHDVNFIALYLASSVVGFEVIIPYDLRDASIPELVDIITTSKPRVILSLKDNKEFESSLQDSISCPIVNISCGVQCCEAPLLVKNPNSTDRYLTIFTSGTTGNPKAISISERAVIARVLDVAQVMEINKDSKILLSGPLNSTTGLLLVFVGLLRGATLVMPPLEGISALPSHVELHKLTHVMLQPLLLKQFINAQNKSDADLSSLKLVAYGAAPMPKSILRQAMSHLSCNWLQGYGLSETFGPFAWMTNDDHHGDITLGRVGRPGSTLEVVILDPEGKKLETDHIGEICVRGKTLMSGYCDFNNNILLPIDGWFQTGDLGKIDKDGFICLSGRASDVIITLDGFKIYPSEVEQLAYKSLSLDEAALVGYKGDNEEGELSTLCLYVENLDESPDVLFKEIESIIKENLSPEKWPHFIHLMSNPLPKNRNNKISKKLLLMQLTKGSILSTYIIKE